VIDLITVRVQGSGIYETLAMPVVPRKGDILWLGSLTRGRKDLPAEVLVSKIEWAMEQVSGQIEAWVTVRRKGLREAIVKAREAAQFCGQPVAFVGAFGEVNHGCVEFSGHSGPHR